MKLKKLLDHWKQKELLPLLHMEETKRKFLHTLLSLDTRDLDQIQEFFSSGPPRQQASLFPISALPCMNQKKRGEEILSSGKAAPLLLAAGEGSRLGFSGPKGSFPLSRIKNKSLFQLFCEKILAAQKKYRREFFFMIMTSPLNQKQSQLFFTNHGYFGLKKEQIFFFSQNLLPLSDVQGCWCLENQELSLRAGGNGDLYKSFVKAGLVEKCREKRIETLVVFPIENPLADPCDANLLGFQEEKQCEIAIKVIKRPKNESFMGGLVKAKNGVGVQEYMYIPLERLSSFSFANTGLYAMSLSFVEKASLLQLPLHGVQKEIADQGNRKMVWKFERFLFDAFFAASKVDALVSAKHVCFAPLKRREGKDGVKEVQKALLRRERQLFFELLKKKPAHRNFELSQEFYYPTSELIELYRQKNSFQENYYKGIDL